MGCRETAKDRDKRLIACAGTSMVYSKALMGFGKTPIGLGGTPMNFRKGRLVWAYPKPEPPE